MEHKPKPRGFMKYDNLQQFRHKQARCSVLIHHTAPRNLAIEMARKYGQIANAYAFCRDIDKGEVKHYTLVEYQSVASVKSLMSNTKQFPNNFNIPIETRLLYCQYPSNRRFSPAVFGGSELIVVDNYGSCHLTTMDLMSCPSVDSQISLLYQKQSLSELDIRLRYFLCSEIEAVVRKLYPNADAQMFGSSVNGFGRYDCDLDIVLDLWNGKRVTECDENFKRHSGGMYFMSKMRSDNERLNAQNNLDFLGGLIQNIVPQMINVRRILKARIPIIKFLHGSSGIDCDMCIDNRYAQDMSELLFFLSEWDVENQKVPALVFTIRHWARCHQITRNNPGHWMSNFMLTLLTVHFLQTRSNPVLPSLKSLKHVPGPAKVLSSDISLPADCAKTTAASSVNSQRLDELLLEFFQYYTEFNFNEFGISIIDGSRVTKPDADVALFIENPLERELNVAKNVQVVYLQEFQSKCQTAYTTLLGSLSPLSAKPWGLLDIFKVTDQEVPTDVNNSENNETWTYAGSSDYSAKGQVDDPNISCAKNSAEESDSARVVKPTRLNVRVTDMFEDTDSSQDTSVLHSKP